MRTTKNQTITERPVIERKYEIPNEPTKSRCFGLARRQEESQEESQKESQKESKWCRVVGGKAQPTTKQLRRCL